MFFQSLQYGYSTIYICDSLYTQTCKLKRDCGEVGSGALRQNLPSLAKVAFIDSHKGQRWVQLRNENRYIKLHDIVHALM